MHAQVTDSIILEYIQRGIASPSEVRDLQITYGLSHRQVEDLVSDLIAHGVCILDDGTAEHLRSVQTPVFYQDRRRYNSLLNELPLHRLMAVLLLLPDEEEVEVSSFHGLPNWRQHLRKLSRLRLITAGQRKDVVCLSERFRRIQRAIHAYLDSGYVSGLRHCWRQAVNTDVVELAETICQSPFFSVIVLAVVRESYLSLPEIQKFISWIAECQPQPPSMCDIVRHAISHGELREVWWLLLGDAPSSAPTAIENGSNVCFKYLKIGECTAYFTGRFDWGPIRGLLCKYRHEIAAEFLRKLADGPSSIDELVPLVGKDVMLLEFSVTHNVVGPGKAFLEDIGFSARGVRSFVKMVGCTAHLKVFGS